MSERKITVTIDPMGNPKIEAHNFHGVGCEAATANIEKAISGSQGGVERVMKPEWYESEGQTQQEQQYNW